VAAEALSGMVMVPRNRKRFVQDDHNIALLLQLLDPEEGNSGNKKFLISILMSLTSCNSARKKIVSSGYAKNIDKLAGAEVSCDAKKLVKKLSTNKFRSMLNGIQHSWMQFINYFYLFLKLYIYCSVLQILLICLSPFNMLSVLFHWPCL
jgi:hypothetical protein